MSRRLSLAMLATTAGLMLLAGCNLSTRYPKTLEYPLRSDVLVGDKALTEEPTRLPSPGRLEESIRAALEKQDDSEWYDPDKLSAEDRAKLKKQLTELFGTPARPKLPVAGELKLNYEKGGAAPVALNTPKYLEKGSELFRMHCMHCHGVPGNGRGPTGPWLHPHPRDYRRGLFKFISSVESKTKKPRLADLRRVLLKGVDGTSMPAFNVLPEEEIEALVGYVVHLSIRGETEFNTMKWALDAGRNPEDKIEKKAEDYALNAAKGWVAAEGALNAPVAYPDKYVVKDGMDESARRQVKHELDESIRRGHRLFLDLKGGQCVKCHLDYGRQSLYRYDVWGTLVKPRDLTAGQYRGGRRPLDLYWRITSGISPSTMSAFNPATAELDGKPAPADAAWDIVNFVQALPHPHMLPADVRKKVYGKAEERFKVGKKSGHAG